MNNNQCFSTSKLDKVDMNFFVEKFLNSSTKDQMIKVGNIISSFTQVLITKNIITKGSND